MLLFLFDAIVESWINFFLKFFPFEERPQYVIARLIFFFTTTLSPIVAFILVVGAGEEALISA